MQNNLRDDREGEGGEEGDPCVVKRKLSATPVPCLNYPREIFPKQTQFRHDSVVR